MLEGLNKINWDNLYHAYGVASDLPLLLKQIAHKDEAMSTKALTTLFGNVYHQGTRWEASAYVVPFLFDLLRNKDTLNRNHLLKLVLFLAIGDDFLKVDKLPFEAEKMIQLYEDFLEHEKKEIIQKLHNESHVLTNSEVDKFNRLVILWAKECYRETEARVSEICQLMEDENAEVAKMAICSLPWFYKHQEIFVEPMLRLLQKNESLDLKVTALLTVGVIQNLDQRFISHLENYSSVNHHFFIRLASVISLVECGIFVHEELLFQAEAQRPLINEFGAKIPYDRPLIGFVAHARNLVAKQSR
ncbi:MAG: hypothetical protein AAF490_26570 [Chloroflexota bacterium]